MSELTGVMVKMAHLRQAKMCSKGARRFFERHGLDFAQFLAAGLDSGLIRATGDAMAIKVAEVAEAEAAIEAGGGAP